MLSSRPSGSASCMSSYRGPRYLVNRTNPRLTEPVVADVQMAASVLGRQIEVNGCIIVIMQRLHQDDLVGHVLEQEPWEVLSFPAIAQEDEEVLFETACGVRRFKRKAGEALHPERESLVTLNAIRQTIG